MAVTDRTRRRRRSPEEAQREIIAAAEALLRERPFRELTVDELMRRTELSRPSFYVYFRDRHQLVLAVVGHLEADFVEVASRWYHGSGDSRTLLHQALEGVVGVYERHGCVLCAVADAAADDPGVEEVYGQLIQTFVDMTARHIDAEIAAGTIKGLDAVPIATALTYATERYLGTTLGREPFAPSDEVLQTISTLWTRTLYGT